MVWVFDVETYPNIFTFVFRKISKDREIKIFEISSRRDNREGLISFLKQKNLTLVGFNNVAFDYPILHKILTNKRVTLKSLFDFVSNSLINNKEFRIPEWKHKIPQIDLFLIWHYNNMARLTSLKYLEFTLRWHKLQDLPFAPGTVIPENKFDFLIEYNINDVDFTYFFTGKSINAIMFRQNMSKQLNHNVMNYSDVKIGEYMNRLSYSKRAKIPWKEFKDLRTERNIIYLKDVIPKIVSYKTKYLQDFLKEISDKSFTDEESFDRILEIGGVRIKFAKGGLHTEDEPRQFICKPGYKLKEKDIGSMAQLKSDELTGNPYRAISSQAYRVGRFRDYLSYCKIA